MIYILIGVLIYIVSVFILRSIIIDRFKARLTIIDLVFILLPVFNTCILIGKGFWIALHVLKKLFTKFTIWFINKNRAEIDHD